MHCRSCAGPLTTLLTCFYCDLRSSLHAASTDLRQLVRHTDQQGPAFEPELWAFTIVAATASSDPARRQLCHSLGEGPPSPGSRVCSWCVTGREATCQM